MNRTEILAMQGEFVTLMHETSRPRWDADDERMAKGSAKAIGKEQWADAIRVCREIQIAEPHLPRPTPGANPSGFVTLTWDNGSAIVDVKLNPSLTGKRISWTARRDGVDHDYESDTLRPLVESLRATFPEVLS